MSDIECPQCGHRALSVATRCPRCGYEFSADQMHRRAPAPGRRGLGPAALLAGALAAAVGMVLLLRSRGGDLADPPPSPGSGATLSAARTGDLSEPAAGLVPPRADPPSAERPSLRYARTWINVRAARGPRAPAVRVLEPGDSVLVDSLIAGWYRVLDGARPVGYAHRRFFTARHPADGPEP